MLLVQRQAMLNVKRESLWRIQQGTEFLYHCQSLVQEECQTWQNIAEQSINVSSSSNLEHLSSLCEEVRMILNFRNSVKQLLYNDSFLRRLGPHLGAEIKMNFEILQRLLCSVVWWIRKLILVGTRVISHCNPSYLSVDVLWGVTRGVEEFNSIVRILRNQLKVQFSTQYYGETLIGQHDYSHGAFPHCLTHLPTISQVSFQSMLVILASERCKHATALAHWFFTSTNPVQQQLKCAHLSKFSWRLRHCNKLEGKTGSCLETSDYHTSSTTSLNSSSQQRFESLHTPDLCNEEAPLTGFANREREFALKFLEILNHSTRILHMLPQATILKAKVLQRECWITDPCATIFLSSQLASTRTISNLSDFPNKFLTTVTSADQAQKEKHKLLQRQDTSLQSGRFKKKSVTWGDSSQSELLHVLVDIYMDILWQEFEKDLSTRFSLPAFGKVQESDGQDMGSLMLYNDHAVLMIGRCMQQTCFKDVFPPESLVYLYKVARNIQCTAAWRAWDQAVSVAIGGQALDKCHPVPLMDGGYCTQTAFSIRMALLPLEFLLEYLTLPKELLNDGVYLEDNLVKCLEACLNRFQLTCQISKDWLATKLAFFFSQGAIAGFLLLLYGDHKVVATEIEWVLNHVQFSQAASHKPFKDTVAQLTNLATEIERQVKHLKERFQENLKDEVCDFFKANIPSSKVWKKTTKKGEPESAGEYVLGMIEHFLEPILTGCSKLPDSFQAQVWEQTLTAVCTAWMDILLKSKFRFSYYGAVQLSLDVGYLVDWLALNTSATLSTVILSTRSLQTLQGVVELLLDQPHQGTANGARAFLGSEPRVRKPRGNKVGHADEGPTSAAFNSYNGGRNRKTSTVVFHHPSDIEDENTMFHQSVANGKVKYVSNPEVWITLRLDGTTGRTWHKIFRCLP